MASVATTLIVKIFADENNMHCTAEETTRLLEQCPPNQTGVSMKDQLYFDKNSCICEKCSKPCNHILENDECKDLRHRGYCIIIKSEKIKNAKTIGTRTFTKLEFISKTTSRVSFGSDVQSTEIYESSSKTI